MLRRDEDAQEAVSGKVVLRFSMKKETNWTWILRKYTKLSCEDIWSWISGRRRIRGAKRVLEEVNASDGKQDVFSHVTVLLVSF